MPLGEINLEVPLPKNAGWLCGTAEAVPHADGAAQGCTEGLRARRRGAGGPRLGAGAAVVRFRKEFGRYAEGDQLFDVLFGAAFAGANLAHVGHVDAEQLREMALADAVDGQERVQLRLTVRLR